MSKQQANAGTPPEHSKSENRRQSPKRKAPRSAFKKGQTGNPGGRPKGLAAMVREQTKDGTTLVNLHIDIMEGKLLVSKSHFDKDGCEHVSNDQPSHKDRLLAAQWLADRGFGKVSETMTLQNQDGSNLIPQEIIEAASKIARGL